MSRHVHSGGPLTRRPVDNEYVAYHGSGDDPGLLVVRGVPAETCPVCDEHWFDERVGFALSRLLVEHEPRPGQVRTVNWVETDAA